MSSKVTYGEIIEALSRKTGFSKQKSEAFTKALIQKVQEELEENGKASITNFGSFKVKEVAERQGQNPQTGEPITIPAHKRVSFTPYKALRERVNEKYAHLESEVIEDTEVSESKDESSGNIILVSDDDSSDSASGEAISNISDQRSRKLKYADRRKGNNVGLMIAAALMLVVVAIVSLWFLFNSDKNKMVSNETVMQQNQSPQAASQLLESEPESNEAHESETKPVETDPVFEATSEMNGTQKKPIETEAESIQNPENATDTSSFTVKQDEWYWVIARQVYGKERFWPIIFMYNSSHGVHPDSLEEGINLEIPSLEGTANNPTKNDLKLLAEATKIVAEAYRQNGRKDKADEYARFANKWAQMAQ